MHRKNMKIKLKIRKTSENGWRELCQGLWLPGCCKYCPVIPDGTFRFQSVWPSIFSLKFRWSLSVLYPCYRASTYQNTNTGNTECSLHTPSSATGLLVVCFPSKICFYMGFLTFETELTRFGDTNVRKERLGHFWCPDWSRACWAILLFIVVKQMHLGCMCVLKIASKN